MSTEEAARTMRRGLSVIQKVMERYVPHKVVAFALGMGALFVGIPLVVEPGLHEQSLTFMAVARYTPIPVFGWYMVASGGALALMSAISMIHRPSLIPGGALFSLLVGVGFVIAAWSARVGHEELGAATANIGGYSALSLITSVVFLTLVIERWRVVRD